MQRHAEGLDLGPVMAHAAAVAGLNTQTAALEREIEEAMAARIAARAGTKADAA